MTYWINSLDLLSTIDFNIAVEENQICFVFRFITSSVTFLPAAHLTMAGADHTDFFCREIFLNKTY